MSHIVVNSDLTREVWNVCDVVNVCCHMAAVGTRTLALLDLWPCVVDLLSGLLARVAACRSSMVPPRNRPYDPAGDPARHGGVWTPWRNTTVWPWLCHVPRQQLYAIMMKLLMHEEAQQWDAAVSLWAALDNKCSSTPSILTMAEIAMADPGFWEGEAAQMGFHGFHMRDGWQPSQKPMIINYFGGKREGAAQWLDLPMHWAELGNNWIQAAIQKTI